jgi:hypothetical protein
VTRVRQLALPVGDEGIEHAVARAIAAEELREREELQQSSTLPA